MIKYSYLKLIRIRCTDDGVYGFIIPSMDQTSPPLVWSLERPLLDNKTNISCIPEGTYKVRQYQSRKFGLTWRLEDVPGRTDILIHAGNTITDSKGCILVGRSAGTYSKKNGVWQSREGMKVLKAKTEKEFMLTIESSYV